MLLDGNPIQKVWSAVGWQTLMGGGGFGVMRLGRDSFLEAQYSTVSGWVATGAPLRAARAGAPGARCARIENGPRRRKPWATVFPFTSYMFLFSFSFRIR